MADDLSWWAKKMGGIMSADTKPIKLMDPGESWVSPKYSGSAKFIHEAEQVRPKNISLHRRGGLVKHGSSTRVSCKGK